MSRHLPGAGTPGGARVRRRIGRAAARSAGQRIYEPTPDGSAALRQWLDSPTTLDDEAPRVSFLVKVFFGRRMRRSNLEALLDKLEAKTRRDADALIAVHEGLDSHRFRFERLTARHGILMKQARLAWIAEARGTFELAGGEVS